MMMEDLKPAKLLKIPIKINNIDLLAMIDTGSNESYIQAHLADKLYFIVDKEKGKEIIGFGGIALPTEGTTVIKVKISGMFKNINFNVINSPDMKHDVILGLDFLKTNKVKLALKKRIVTIGKKTEENVSFHVNDDNCIDKYSHNNISVYAAQDGVIDRNSTEMIPIHISEVEG